MTQEEYLRECRRNPCLAKDFEADVIDTNVELLLHNNDAFEEVKLGLKKRELETIK